MLSIPTSTRVISFPFDRTYFGHITYSFQLLSRWKTTWPKFMHAFIELSFTCKSFTLLIYKSPLIILIENKCTVLYLQHSFIFRRFKMLLAINYFILQRSIFLCALINYSNSLFNWLLPRKMLKSLTHILKIWYIYRGGEISVSDEALQCEHRNQ